MNRNLHLGQLGTFDVENYGDLLYPILFEKMLARRHHGMAISKFSLRGSDDLQGSGYQTRPVRQLFSSGKEQPHTLVIGGGDILRTDWRRVASHYQSIMQEEGENLSPSFWRRIFTSARKPLDNESEFRRRYMDYPAPGPFMIRPGGSSMIRSVAYCSCGVPFPFEENFREQIADTFDQASFVYVRDEQSRQALQHAGVTRDIQVAPDLIVVLSDFFDRTAEREKGRKILRQHGVDPARPLLIFQCNVQPPEYTDGLVQELKAYQARTGCEVVILPLGRCLGDCEYLKKIAQCSQGAFKYIESRSIFDILSLLAACDVFLGTSLHGNITAFSFGIPHLFGPIQVAKREGFLEIVNLPPDAKLESWAQLNSGLDLALARDHDFFKTKAAIAKQRVHETFDALCRALEA